MNNAKYSIRKTNCIKGIIPSYSSKNLITKAIIALLLSFQSSRLYIIPRIGETIIILKILSHIGVFFVISSDYIYINASKIINRRLIYDKNFVNRTPILILSVFLNRIKKGYIPKMGGDRIGKRKINYHIIIMRQYGANFYTTISEYIANIRYKLFSIITFLSYSSVGASESCIFLGIYSKGINIIYNIAIEPEILELIFILRNMGAIIIMNKKRQIIIHGIKILTGISFDLIKDRIESFSWACLTYISQGETQISINANLLQNYYHYINKTHFYYYRNSVIFIKNYHITPKKLETNVYPYFATDLQQIICILLTTIKGISIMHETVYENRLKYIRILKKLGLKVKVLNLCLGKYCQYQSKSIYHTILIYGANRNIIISKFNVHDIREGFAFLMLSIYGKSQNLNNIIHIERGYGNIISRLIDTNLQIKRYNIKNII